MKKNLLLRLCLMMVLALSIYSCVSDDLLVSSSDSSQNISSARYSSKSPWAEDQIYITKVQQVFLKHANLPRFNETYGKLNWDYAMSFGQFGERYALVPIVKKDKVVLIMEAVRKENKVYFYEKKDADLLQFFNYMLYSPISGYKEVIDGTDPAAKAKYVCTTRTIVVGCPAGMQDCEPITSTQMVCEFRDDTGGGIPPMGLNPCGDPFGGGCGGGGSGDDGYEYPEPPQEDPCAKTKTLLEDPAVTEKVGTLKEKSKIKKGQPGYGEKAFVVNNDGTSSGMIDGEEHSVRVGSTVGKQGVYHNHTPNGIKMPSPPDIIKMLHYALSQPNGNISNGFLGMVGSEVCSTCPGGYKYHNYIIRFSGTLQELGGFVNQTNWDEDALNKDFEDREWEMRDSPLYTNDYGKLNSNGLQKLFFDTLKNMGVEGKINLQKVEDNGSVQNIVLDNTGNPSAIPCP